MIKTLAQWMVGEFNNRQQAIDDPVWYVHLKLWHRPVQCDLGEYCIFAEQANVLQLDQPYRQRLLVLTPTANDEIQGQYWAFKDPQKYKSAGENPSLLGNIQWSDLTELPGCKLKIQRQGNQYQAKPHPDLRCCFDYAGKTRQVEIGFELEPQRLTSYDKGVDPETGKALWGALMGPYRFDKDKDYDL